MQIFRFAYFNKAPRQVTPLSHEFLLRGLCSSLLQGLERKLPLPRFAGAAWQPSPWNFSASGSSSRRKMVRQSGRVGSGAAGERAMAIPSRAGFGNGIARKIRFAMPATERKRENLFREASGRAAAVALHRSHVSDNSRRWPRSARSVPARSAQRQSRILPVCAGRLCAPAWLAFAGTQNRKTLQILRHLSRESRTAPSAQNSSPRCRMRDAAAKPVAAVPLRESNMIFFVAGFALQFQLGQRFVEMSHPRVYRFSICSTAKASRPHSESSVRPASASSRRSSGVRYTLAKKAGHRCTERDALLWREASVPHLRKESALVLRANGTNNRPAR